MGNRSASIWPSVPRRSVLSVNTEPVTVLPSVKSSRRWRSPSTSDTSHPSAVPTASSALPSESGSAAELARRSPAVPGSHTPRTTPSSPWVSVVSVRTSRRNFPTLSLSSRLCPTQFERLALLVDFALTPVLFRCIPPMTEKLREQKKKKKKKKKKAPPFFPPLKKKKKKKKKS